MKKYFFITALWSVFLLSSCANEERLTFTEQNITTKNNKIAEINLSLCNEDTNVATNINKSIKSLVSQQLSESKPQILPLEAQISAFNKQYLLFKESFPNSPISWEAQIDSEVTYQNKQLISIVVSSYLNKGGAHGITNVSFLNFNAKTGAVLNNNDLFNDFELFTQTAQTYFNEQTKDQELSLFNPNKFKLPKNIGFYEDDIVLLYNTFEIAPYSDGIIEILIPFEAVSRFLKYIP